MPDEPRVLSVSITEMQEYLRCRRAWDYQSANRQSLVKRGVPATALWMGSAIHKALEMQIRGQSPKRALDAYVSRMREEMASEYLRKVGAPMSSNEWTSFDESASLCNDVTRAYFEHYGMSDTYAPYKALCSEMTFRIPMGQMGVYDVVYLIGTIDGVLFDPRYDAIGGIDHKTYSQRADVRDLQLNDQFVGYTACLELLIRQEVSFFVYNGLNKKVPSQPRVLKDGTLSVAKDCVTTAKTFERAVIANGEDPKSSRYEQHLAWLRLREQEDHPFFTRHTINIPKAVKDDWWSNVLAVLNEMASEPAITFNRRWEGCWDCNVRDLCEIQSRGDNLRYAIETGYTIGTYGTQSKLKATVTPADVSSLDDLRNWIAQSATD